MRDIRTPRTVSATAQAIGRQMAAEERKHEAPMSSDWQITAAMLQFGGSFVQGLGTLYRQADAENQAKLRYAFRGYFAEYAEIAKLQAARNAVTDTEAQR